MHTKPRKFAAIMLCLALILTLLPIIEPVVKAAAPPTITPIAIARVEPAGTVVTVTGIVTVRDVQTTYAANRGDSVVIQDATGGISVRLRQDILNNYTGTTFSSQNIKIGDEITVTGKIGAFNTMIQLDCIVSGTNPGVGLDNKVDGAGLTDRPAGVPLDVANLQTSGPSLESQYVALSGDFEVTRVVAGSQSGVHAELKDVNGKFFRAKFLDENGHVQGSTTAGFTGSLPIVGQVYTITGGAVSRGGAVAGIGLAANDFILLLPADAYTLLPPSKVLPVTASPASGADVAEGADITLSCATAGADIFYTFDTSALEADFDPLPATGKVTVNFGSGTSVTLRAYATKTSLDPSDTASFTYNKAATVTVISIPAARGLALGSPAAVEGVVTSVGNNATTFFMQTSMGTAHNDGIQVQIASAATYVGQYVRVTGYRTESFGVPQISGSNTNPSANTTQIQASDITVIRAATPAELAPVPVRLTDLSPGTGIGRMYDCMKVSLEKVQITQRNAATTTQNHFIGDGSQTGNASNVVIRAAWATGAPYVDGSWLKVDVGYVYWYSPNVQLLHSTTTGITAPPATEGADVIAEWLFSKGIGSGYTSTVVDATGGMLKTGAGLSRVTNGTTVNHGYNPSFPANVSGNGWDALNSWWQVKISTENYINIRVEFGSTSSGTGPGFLKVQYSLDGTTWTDAFSPIYGPLTLNDNDPTKYNKDTKFLPMGADNQSALYIRWIPPSTVSQNGGTMVSGGTNRLFDVIVTGDFAPPPGYLRAPTADTPSGEILLNDVITFRPGAAADLSQPGYSYEYRTSGDSGGTWSLWTTGASLTVTALPLNLELKATADGGAESRVSAYSYTQKQTPAAVPSKSPGPVLLPNTLGIDCDDPDAILTYSINGGPTQPYTGPFELTGDMFIGTPGKLTIEIWSARDNYATNKATYEFTVADLDGARVYFGMIHSHSTLSDGSGSPEEAYRYAKEVAGLDFYALTDHSNSLGEPTTQNGDNPATIDLNTYNTSVAAWQRMKAAAAAKHEDGVFVAIPAYEMTWSGGPGHMNTFNTAGFVSRNNSTLNGKPYSGMLAYYELLERTPGSIAMFNHPGATFGNFNNFAYYNPLIGQRVTLIEVGNGEGAIGGGGYFPSYEQYDLALDKGWFVAPTNNQDNHMGKWGNSNTARTAIWTNDLTLEGVYQAFRDRRVYSTEVADLEIDYRVNGLPLGSIIEVLPASANFTAGITNPTAGNFVKSVCLISNGGLELELKTPGTQNYSYDVTIANPDSGYYYLKVIVGTPKGDRIAVTAPVWLGRAKIAGFNTVDRSAAYPVTTEPLTVTAQLFNSEKKAATVQSIKFEVTDIAGVTTNLGLPSDGNGMIVAANGTLDKIVSFTPSVPGDFVLTVTAVLVFGDGETKEYTYTVEYEVLDITKLTFIGVDGSHYNEYAALSGAAYNNNMTNFSAVAAGYGVRVVTLTTGTDLIAALDNPQYRAFVMTVPSRRRDNNPTPAGVLDYTAEELAAVKRFTERGGTLIVTGWNNLYEDYASLSAITYERLMASQQNQLLATVGSTLRVSRDGAADRDDANPNNTGLGGPGSNNYWPNAGNPPHRLFPSGLDPHFGYDMDHPLLAGVEPVQVFSQYGGTTIYAVAPDNANDWEAAPAVTLPDSVSRAISLPPGARSLYRGNAAHKDTPGYPLIVPNTYEKDGRQQYMILATETVQHSNGMSSEVIVAGGAFMSNFEIKTAAPDNIADLYSNQNIVINIIKSIAPEPEITPIPVAKTLPIGTRVTVEGTVMSNVYQYGANNTGFFDSIYIQDADGNGINLHPVSTGVVEGQFVRVTGRVGEYQGEKQVGTVSRVEIIDPAINIIGPTGVTSAASMQPANTGKLVEIKGYVSAIVTVDGLIAQFTVNDGSGPALVYINAYITSSLDLSDIVREGNYVSVVGFASIGENLSSSDPLPRIRVRDRNEIAAAEAPPVTPPDPSPITPPDKIQVSDLIVGEDSVSVKLTDSKSQFSSAASSELVKQNKDKDILISGNGVSLLIPAGTLEEGADLNDYVVKPGGGNAIRVTYPDGSTVILPLAIVDGSLARYVATENGKYELIDNTKTFPDIEGHWGESSIDWVTRTELFAGDEKGNFNPNQPMTRAMLVTVLWRIANKPVVDSNGFADVKEGSWYEEAVDWASTAGIVGGYGNGNFGPNDPVTREQLCVILFRFAKVLGLVPDETVVSDAEFKDMDKVSSWAIEGVKMAINAGIILGKPGALIDPQGNATRAEIATILHRFVNNVLPK